MKKYTLEFGNKRSLNPSKSLLEKKRRKIKNKGMLAAMLAMVMVMTTSISAKAGPSDDAKDLKNPIIYKETDEYFRAHEWSADIYGTYSDVIRRDSGMKFYSDGFGGGLGINYFFTKYVGFGLEGSGWDANHGGVGGVNGDILFRYPFEGIHLAPYAMIGGGYDFGDRGSWKGDVGAGLEYRFTPHIGVFADGRFVLVENGSVNNYDLARLGVRYAF